MSLGFTNGPKKFSSISASQEKHGQKNDNKADVVARVKTIRLFKKCTTRNIYSIYSPCSCFSVISLVSSISLASLGSFASIGSTLSLFSITSVLSFASTNSVLSAFSTNCYMHILSDCTQNPETNSSFHIDVSRDTFDLMSTCTKEMYQTYQATDGQVYRRECGYQDAQCKYTSGDNTTGWMGCEIRRKGSTTWKSMNDKPSFKIRNMEYVDFTTGNIVSKDYVKENNKNHGIQWATEKLTLNNAAHPGSFYQTWSEVDAYNLFRRIGKQHAPRAKWTKVHLKINGQHFRTDTYAAIESISDKYFIENDQSFYKKDWSLYEIEANAIEFKRSSVDEIDDYYNEKGINVGDVANQTFLATHFSPEITDMNEDDAIKYYVGEVITGHWDGACFRDDMYNNYYLALEYSKRFMIIINSGLDNTFQGCLSDILSSKNAPTCLFMQQCFANTTCHAKYVAELQKAESRTDIRKTPSCAEELLPGIRSILLGFFIPIVLLVLLDKRLHAYIKGKLNRRVSLTV